MRDTLATARAYAERVAKGDDPYRTATGELVKAYRADWDGTLQPYALYVPRGYDGQNKKQLGFLAAHRRAARRVLRPQAQPAAGVRARQPAGRDRRRGLAQPAPAPRRPGVRRLAARPRRADGLRRPRRRRRHARDRRRAPRLQDRSRAHHAHRPLDGGRRDLGDWPAPPRAVRRAGAGLRRRRLPPHGPTGRRRALRSGAARRAVAARHRRERRAPAGLHLPRRQGSDRPGRGLAPDGRALQGARLAGQERPLHRVSGRRAFGLDSRLQGRRAAEDAGRDQTRSGRAQDAALAAAARARRSRASPARASPASTRTSTSTARTVRPRRWPRRARWRAASPTGGR